MAFLKTILRSLDVNDTSEDLESEIQRITEQLANRTAENEKLDSFKENLKQVYDDLSGKKDLIQYHDFSYSLLKDSGVKSKIIKKYLPLINQQVNRYLQMMDFYINFTLDEEFNETVQSPIHEDFSYSSFSEGEKQRIDLALLFTWRKLQNSKTQPIQTFSFLMRFSIPLLMDLGQKSFSKSSGM